jgi:hypothetical protein
VKSHAWKEIDWTQNVNLARITPEDQSSRDSPLLKDYVSLMGRQSVIKRIGMDMYRDWGMQLGGSSHLAARWSLAGGHERRWTPRRALLGAAGPLLLGSLEMLA